MSRDKGPITSALLVLCFIAGMMPDVCALCTVERASMSCNGDSSDSEWTSACCCLVTNPVEAAPAFTPIIVDSTSSVAFPTPAYVAFLKISSPFHSGLRSTSETQRLSTPVFLLYRSLLI